MMLSVVIVNYNIKEYVLQALHSLRQFPVADMEIIVVDNNSVDGSVQAIKEEFPEVILLENNYNAGFPVANNQAFRIAKGKYILMLNPDAAVFENSLSLLIRFLDTHNDYSTVVPQLVHQDGRLQQSVWRFPTVLSVFAESFHLGFLLKKKNYNDIFLAGSFDVESASGAAILFRNSVLDQAGLLDESLFWIEDVDFCKRIVDHGGKIKYLPESKVLHHVSKSAKKDYRISISNQIFNKIKYFRKHHSWLEYILVYSISFVHILYKLFFFSILFWASSVFRRKCKAYFYTLVHVFNIPNKFKAP